MPLQVICNPMIDLRVLKPEYVKTEHFMVKKERN